MLSGQRSDLQRCLLKLEAVEVPFCPPRDHTFRSLISFQNQNLCELRLYHNWFTGPDDIEAWIRECCSYKGFPRLTAFELDFHLAHSDYHLTDGLKEALLDFVKMHPRLELLTLPEFPDEMIRVLDTLPVLKALTFRMTRYDDVIAALCRSHLPPSLTWLLIRRGGSRDASRIQPTEWVRASIAHLTFSNPLIQSQDLVLGILSRLPILRSISFQGSNLSGEGGFHQDEMPELAQNLADRLPVVEYIDLGWTGQFRVTRAMDQSKSVIRTESSDIQRLLSYYRPSSHALQ